VLLRGGGVRRLRERCGILASPGRRLRGVRLNRLRRRWRVVLLRRLLLRRRVVLLRRLLLRWSAETSRGRPVRRLLIARLRALVVVRSKCRSKGIQAIRRPDSHVVGGAETGRGGCKAARARLLLLRRLAPPGMLRRSRRGCLRRRLVTPAGRGSRRLRLLLARAGRGRCVLRGCSMGRWLRLERSSARQAELIRGLILGATPSANGHE
jgi:hypothetical protein